MATLRDIGNDIQALRSILDESADAGGEVTDEQVSAAVDKWFAESMDNQAEKLDDYVGLVWEREGYAETARRAREHYAKIERVNENAAERLKKKLKEHLERTGQSKVKTATATTIRIQANSTAPLVVTENLDLHTVPAEFITTTVELNTKAVKEALKAGKGLHFAKLGELGSHVRIS